MRQSRRRMTRRRFIAGIAALPIAGGVYGFLIEPSRVDITRHVPRAASGRSIRMVQLSDLHLRRADGHMQRVASDVNELNADVLFLTGDVLDSSDRIGELQRFLRLIDRTTPKYAILGNWEHWGRVGIGQLRRVYAEAGCRLLINETVIHSHAGQEVLVTGMDDWTGGAPDITAALSGARPHDCHIMLAHSPVYRDVLVEELANRRPDAIQATSISLVLSGHTHGGQIAPFGWAPVRPAGSGRYVAGWYSESSPPMYVSRGLGTSVLPIRFGAPPEIAVFDWPLP